eukprot:jgi/Undpi1/5422/HiC_scaffold_2.g00703.m1
MLLCGPARVTLLVLISWSTASGFVNGGTVNRGGGGGIGTPFARQLGTNTRHSSPRVPFTSVSRKHRDMGTEGRGTAAAVAASTTANAAGAGVDVASGVAGDAAGCETGTPLFLYGTLMNDKVLSALIDRVPPTQKACLSGYHRYQIRDHVFPGIRPKEGGSVEGLFMEGLNAREKLIFDLFEDDYYYKVDVEVKVGGLEETRTATVYVWSASAEDQLYGTWDPLTHFADNGPVPDYVAMVQRFARHIQTEGLLDAEETA